MICILLKIVYSQVTVYAHRKASRTRKEAPTGGPNTRTPLERVPSTMVKVLSSHRHTACITHPDGDLLPLADKSPPKQSGGFIHGLCSLILPSEICTQRSVAAVNNTSRQRFFAHPKPAYTRLSGPNGALHC